MSERYNAHVKFCCIIFENAVIRVQIRGCILRSPISYVLFVAYSIHSVIYTGFCIWHFGFYVKSHWVYLILYLLVFVM